MQWFWKAGGHPRFRGEPQSRQRPSGYRHLPTKRGTGEGVARPGSDYHATSGRLTFAAGDTEKTASVRVREDEEQDGRETLTFLLTSAVGATITDAEATGTILNTPNGQRGPTYYGHDRPDWSPGQIFPTSVTSTEDHVIDMEWVAPSVYTARKFRSTLHR